ncbi:MAG: hypothetical protein ACM3VV_03385 [Deltaproteobacteria bacterium]
MPSISYYCIFPVQAMTIIISLDYLKNTRRTVSKMINISMRRETPPQQN